LSAAQTSAPAYSKSSTKHGSFLCLQFESATCNVLLVAKPIFHSADGVMATLGHHYILGLRERNGWASSRIIRSSGSPDSRWPRHTRSIPKSPKTASKALSPCKSPSCTSFLRPSVARRIATYSVNYWQSLQGCGGKAPAPFVLH
jgi:hypothetical protein